MTSKTHEIGIGTAVTYEDMANPLRRGTIVGEVAGQWAVKWDGYDGGATLLEQDGVEFHATVTKHMLAGAVKRQTEFRAAHNGSGRCGGWDAIVRPCAICGGEVTSPNPTVDYCRMCFYTGAAYERMLRTEERDLLTRVGALDGVEDAQVWHTGGGCFNLAIRLADGRFLTPSVGIIDEESGEVWPEPGIPNIAGIIAHENIDAEQPTEEKWCLVVSANEDVWGEWREEDIRISQRLFTDAELVEAVASTVKGEEV